MVNRFLGISKSSKDTNKLGYCSYFLPLLLSYSLSENHLTVASYEKSYIVKSIMFQFANSYASLFYLAFAKGMLFAHSSICCLHTFPGRTSLFGEAEKCDPSCVQELALQLASILVTNFTVGQLQEIVLPYPF